MVGDLLNHAEVVSLSKNGKNNIYPPECYKGQR